MKIKIYTILLFSALLLAGCSFKTENNSVKNPEEQIPNIEKIANLTIGDLVVTPEVLSFGNLQSTDPITSQEITITNSSINQGKILLSAGLTKFKVDTSSSCLTGTKGYKLLYPNQSCKIKILFNPATANGMISETILLKDVLSNNLNIGSIPIYASASSNNPSNAPINGICKVGSHIENRVCTLDSRSCTVTGTTGTQTWLNGTWSQCALSPQFATVNVLKTINTGTVLDINNLNTLYCDETCENQSYTYLDNTYIRLRAIPKSGYKISKWTGCDVVSLDMQFCDVKYITNGKNIAVVFELANYKISLTYTDTILASKIAPIRIYKNDSECIGSCLNTFHSNDKIRITVGTNPQVILKSFTQYGIVNNVDTTIPNEITYTFTNTDVTTNINLQVGTDVTTPLVSIPTDTTGNPINAQPITSASGMPQTIRCYKDTDVDLMMSGTISRLLIPSVIFSEVTPASLDDTNIETGLPSYYGWIFVESDATIRECYNFSATNPSMAYVPPVVSNPDLSTSIRCYSAAGENAITFNASLRTDINATIMSRAVPAEVDTYNVTYRTPVYKGWINQNGLIQQCYEFSGDAQLDVKTKGVWTKAGDILETGWNGTVNIVAGGGKAIADVGVWMWDSSQWLIQKTPTWDQDVAALNTAYHQMVDLFPNVKVKVNVGYYKEGLDHGATDAREVAVYFLNKMAHLQFCAGHGTQDVTCGDAYTQALIAAGSVIHDIGLLGDGTGKELGELWEKLEVIANGHNIKELEKGLVAVGNLCAHNNQYCHPTIMSAEDRKAFEQAAGKVWDTSGDILEVFPKFVKELPAINISWNGEIPKDLKKLMVGITDPPSVHISIPICSWIPHCTWKVSYSCGCGKWGCSCHGSNHLACTFSSSCDALAPSVPQVKGAGIAVIQALSKAIEISATIGVVAPVEGLIATIKYAKKHETEIGNVLEDIIQGDFVGQDVKDAIATIGDYYEEGSDWYDDNIGEPGIDPEDIKALENAIHKVGLEVGRSPENVGTWIHNFGKASGIFVGQAADGYEAFVEKPGDKIWNDMMTSIKNIDFTDGKTQNNTVSASVLNGSNLMSSFGIRFSDNLLKNQLTSVLIYKNGVKCEGECLTSVFTGDKIVVQIVTGNFVQVKKMAATGATVSMVKSTVTNTVQMTSLGNDIVLDVVLDSKNFMMSPIITFVDTSMANNLVKTDKDFVKIWISNASTAQEMLISESRDCSVGSYVPFNAFPTYNIPLANSVLPLSIRLKNGSKLSRCFNYSIMQDTINPVTPSAFTSMPSAQCLTGGNCGSSPLTIINNNPEYQSEITKIDVYKDNVICDSTCQASLMPGDLVGIEIFPTKYVQISNVYQNGMSLNMMPSGYGTSLSFMFVAGNNLTDISIDVSPASFVADPVVLFSNANQVGNQVYTTMDSIGISFLNETIAKEMMISESNDCSIGSYVPLQLVNTYSLASKLNTNFPLSFKFKNGTSISGCQVFSITHDTIAPAVTAQLNKNYTFGPLTVSGTCESGLQVYIADELATYATTCAGNNYSYNYQTVSLIEGLKTLKISQIDLTGNKTEISKQFTLDITPPALSNSNTNLVYSAGGIFTLTGTCESGLPIKIEENGAIINNATGCSVGSYSIDYSPTGAGLIKMSQTDLAGNFTQLNINYSVSMPDQSCLIAHGTGIQQWAGGSYGTCTVISCDPKYEVNNATNSCDLSFVNHYTFLPNVPGMAYSDMLIATNADGSESTFWTTLLNGRLVSEQNSLGMIKLDDTSVYSSIGGLCSDYAYSAFKLNDGTIMLDGGKILSNDCSTTLSTYTSYAIVSNKKFLVGDASQSFNKIIDSTGTGVIIKSLSQVINIAGHIVMDNLDGSITLTPTAIDNQATYKQYRISNTGTVSEVNLSSLLTTSGGESYSILYKSPNGTVIYVNSLNRDLLFSVSKTGIVTPLVGKELIVANNGMYYSFMNYSKIIIQDKITQKIESINDIDMANSVAMNVDLSPYCNSNFREASSSSGMAIIICDQLVQVPNGPSYVNNTYVFSIINNVVNTTPVITSLFGIEVVSAYDNIVIHKPDTPDVLYKLNNDGSVSSIYQDSYTTDNGNAFQLSYTTFDNNKIKITDAYTQMIHKIINIDGSDNAAYQALVLSGSTVLNSINASVNYSRQDEVKQFVFLVSNAQGKYYLYDSTLTKKVQVSPNFMADYYGAYMTVPSFESKDLYPIDQIFNDFFNAIHYMNY